MRATFIRVESLICLRNHPDVGWFFGDNFIRKLNRPQSDAGGSCELDRGRFNCGRCARASRSRSARSSSPAGGRCRRTQAARWRCAGWQPPRRRVLLRREEHPMPSGAPACTVHRQGLATRSSPGEGRSSRGGSGTGRTPPWGRRSQRSVYERQSCLLLSSSNIPRVEYDNIIANIYKKVNT